MSTVIDERCKLCFLKTYQALFEKFNIEITKRQEIMVLCKDIITENQHLSTPEIQRKLQKTFCRIINISDPFEEEKRYSNTIALKLYEEWKPKVLSAKDPIDLALKLSIAGNIMDYGANNSFDVHETINTVLTASFAIDHSASLKQQIKKAKRILYLGDNAGEIVFDRLFIELMMHEDVTYAVKDSPVLNDVTMKDAKIVGMEKAANVISNGFDAPSTILHECSKEFLDIYNSADLIISKGQGNYEGLLQQKDSRIFFLLMAKCDVIAEILNVKKGSFIVFNHNN